ncbi:Folic acid synthesis protein fol1 [Wallemia ichthyophaga EXF-994]|uniref:Folic acid synthesis protein FOL1 n=1 Tax=Wallemia ichthyophaga (strain EXF-994 / CBS 113033) TaxID=1299270 RepID=R9AHC7_WALI9|nr:Folic acid synthesis protein fol1 [Wallemia ichthyophaga EXF-994]EOR01587.1 Folic acid synthesis protein fol1 [Wallemia ichthyophaga EXF-994]
MRDVISINKLNVTSTVGFDRFKNTNAEPLVVDIQCSTSVQNDLDKSINYASLTNSINQACSGTYSNLNSLATAISRATFSYQGVEALNLKLSKCKGLLKGVVQYEQVQDAGCAFNDTYHVSGIDVDTIIGIHPWERQFKQKVVLDVSVPGTDYSHILLLIENLINFLQNSSYHVLEHLALDAAKLAVVQLAHPSITIKAAKPSALTFADSASVQVTRTAADYNVSPNVLEDHPRTTTAVLSLGSNLGNKKAHIHSALSQLEKRGVGNVVDTSHLYATAPMYVHDQPAFLNGVCKITTALHPHTLLDSLKEIERDLGRDMEGQVKGPRPIDLDILLYGEECVHTDTLRVPHAGMRERAFVLRPLADILPNYTPITHSLTTTQALQRIGDGDNAVQLVLPVGDRLFSLRGRRWVMAILNCTPDSFSDGGLNFTLEDALANATRMVQEGADILDVGGMSTRPNAPDVSAHDEVHRVVPLIKTLRSQHPDVLISVDTFRASVARAAVEAGADIVNDVSGGMADEGMLETVADLGVPYILMHMRGDSSTMTSLTQYDAGVVEGVKGEIQQRMQKAMESGIRRWNIIIDPGLGFAKDVNGNLDILRNLSQFGGRCTSSDASLDTMTPTLTPSPNLKLSHMPLLVGHSRKAFIGKLTNVDTAKDRVAGTAATTMAALAGGADIVRVHDIKESVDVAKMARAM